jgi:hypothetical protein
VHTFDLSNNDERLGEEPSILVQRTQRTSVSLDVKLIVLQLVQLIGVRSMTRGSIN